MIVSGTNISVRGSLLRVARLSAEGYEFLEESPEPIIALLKKGNPQADLFTFTQRVPNTTPQHPYFMEWDNCAAIEVASFEQWWKQIRPEARNRARQAEKKGVVIREVPFDETLARGIWEIYNECPIRAGRRFPHYGKDPGTVFTQAATFLDSSVFIGAFLEEKLIGFVKLTTNQTKTQANLMNILSLMAHRDKAPTNALISHAVRACADRKIAYLIYQRFTYGKKKSDGIMKFKETNGFRQFDLPRYYVPLTLRGRIALRLGLHHRLADRLPESLVGRLRDFRNDWYNHKLQVAR